MRRLGLLTLGLLLTGCAVGPDYSRPAITTPEVYRGVSPNPSDAVSTQLLGDQKWWDVFQDPVLQELIRLALQQNYDVRTAASRVLQAQAQLGITRADQFPTVSAGSQVSGEYTPKTSSVFPNYRSNAGELDLSVVWNLDFWGKYRRQTEAAQFVRVGMDDNGPLVAAERRGRRYALQAHQ